MKKYASLLALLLIVSLVGCKNNEDFTDTILNGTWRVSYYISGGDVDTSRFYGYVFTFMADGTVTVDRPGAPTATGNWNEFNNQTRLDLDFSDPGLLQKLDESWVIDNVYDDEFQLHELGAPFKQVHFTRR